LFNILSFNILSFNTKINKNVGLHWPLADLRILSIPEELVVGVGGDRLPVAQVSLELARDVLV
jgi:hypothetical protein